ncbi:hypothetical protein PybrP1_002243, partial [[Pythium] brassicae (nom. inval.)]
KTANVGDIVIREGDTGDYFYVVESGVFNISVSNGSSKISGAGTGGKSKNSHPDGNGSKPEVVGVAQKGATFGELALVYNCPRQATISCAQAGRLWALDRVTFRRLVARNQMDQIGECKSALQKVELLRQLTDAQLRQLAEAAQIVTFAKGERIVKKGERGNVLYIIKTGTVVCSDVGDGRGMESVRLSDNEYFGERALSSENALSAASVTAATDVSLIALDRQAFDDLLGSLSEVIDHNMSMRILRTLGSGTFGRVKLVRHRATGTPYALKVVSKAVVVAYNQQLNILSEKRTMAQCRHPFILRLHQTFQDHDNVYFLLDFVQGGELFTYLHCSPNSPRQLDD